MNTNIQLTIKTLISPDFQRAFKALGEDPVSVVERFRLAQSTPSIIGAISAYDEARQSLLHRLGERESVVLKRKLEARKELAIKTPEDSYIMKRLAEIEAGDEDRMALDNEAKEKFAEYNAEHDRLLAETITLPLKAKVTLSKDSKLTATQIAALLDVVTVDEQEK